MNTLPDRLLAALDVRFESDDLDKNVSVREYLRALLLTLWQEQEGFSGKRPFGNSGWEGDVYIPLIRAGFIAGKVDEDGYLESIDDETEAHLFVKQLIETAFTPAAALSGREAVATVCLPGETYAHGLMTELQVQHAEGVEFPIGTKFYTAPQPGDGVGLIAAERRRQVEVEGWTPEHDDAYQHSEMARAAACYALQTWGGAHNCTDRTQIWPWAESWWKVDVDNPVRSLVKAGALIAAEIDRLQRAAAPSAKGVAK